MYYSIIIKNVKNENRTHYKKKQRVGEIYRIP